MTNLPNLPVEIIELCFSFVKDQQTLAAICRVSTFGQRLATPLLKRNIGVLGNERRLYRLQRLCQRLVEDIAFAESVESITQSVQSADTVPRNGLVLDINRCIKLCAQERNLASAVCEFMYLKELSESDFLLLLLVLCPQVKVLELTGDRTCQRTRYRNRFDSTLEYVGQADDTNSDNSWEGDGSAVSHGAGLYTLEELRISNDAVATSQDVFP